MGWGGGGSLLGSLPPLRPDGPGTRPLAGAPADEEGLPSASSPAPAARLAGSERADGWDAARATGRGADSDGQC